ncbi:MAG TPA: GNAT family N-acetyltransferase, partial [Casimicrobiaceae bacterium]|nr:GNAT family N-acetyltransferase [Casimicrobiaceae bacterium]
TATRGERARRSAYARGSAAARALATLREEGLRSVWFKLLARCGYRRLLLLERPLDLPVADATPKLAVDIAMLVEAEVDQYRAFRPDTPRREVIERLRSGHLCFVARRDGRIVSGVWVAAQPVWSKFLRRWLDVAPGEAHVYDKFTDPAYRGRGIANAVRSRHLRHFQRAGFVRETGAVLPENISSLRDDARGGFRCYGVLASVGIGRWRRVFVRQPRRDPMPASGDARRTT